MNIENYYRELENITSLDSWKLLKQLNPINEKINDQEEEIIKTERKVLAFSLNRGNLYPKTTRVNISGKKGFYPNSEDFTEKEIDYIKSRLNVVNNIWIRSRYSHILWVNTRNNQYAELSIDSYLAIIQKLINNPDNESYNNIVVYIECLLFFGEKTRINLQIIKSKVIELLNSDELPSHIKSRILEFSIDSEIIKTTELEFILNRIIDWVDFKSGGSFFFNQSILNTAILLAQKLQKSNKPFYKLLAENQDLIINQHTDEKDFIRFTTFGEKAKYYKKAGEIENYEDCLKEYTRLKNKFELGHFESKLSDEKAILINDYLNKKSELILQMPIENILTYFSSGDNLLIKNEVLDKLAKEGYDNSFNQIFSMSTFDINSNHKKVTNDERLENERFKKYTSHFNISVFPLMFKVFAFGIINGKISYHSVFQYLQENSWFGQKFPRGMNEGDIDEESNWLSLFAPGLNDYFSQIEWAVIMSNDNIQNFILCIDSLTTKFEGALRDFIRLLGGSTTVEKRGELQEQLLEELLQNKIIIKNFELEDITLFKYVFTNKGWNIRNNVAHCFYPYSSYSFDKATIVFLCILRLGKYKLKPTEKD